MRSLCEYHIRQDAERAAEDCRPSRLGLLKYHAGQAAEAERTLRYPFMNATQRALRRTAGRANLGC